jgi:uncharacterized membrane protein
VREADYAIPDNPSSYSQFVALGPGKPLARHSAQLWLNHARQNRADAHAARERDNGDRWYAREPHRHGDEFVRVGRCDVGADRSRRHSTTARAATTTATATATATTKQQQQQTSSLPRLSALKLKVTGRKVKGRCDSRAKKGTRCTLIVQVGKHMFTVGKGRTTRTFRFPKLAPDRYTVTITAINARGKASNPISLAITVKR